MGITLLLRLRHGMHAEDTAFLLLLSFTSDEASVVCGRSGSSFGRIGRGGIDTWILNVGSSMEDLGALGTFYE
jgi:hypothetical protein